MNVVILFLLLYSILFTGYAIHILSTHHYTQAIQSGLNKSTNGSKTEQIACDFIPVILAAQQGE
jgi:hypothetical protein